MLVNVVVVELIQHYLIYLHYDNQHHKYYYHLQCSLLIYINQYYIKKYIEIIITNQ